MYQKHLVATIGPVRVPETLSKRVAKFIKDSVPETNTAALTRAALDEFLSKRGY